MAGVAVRLAGAFEVSGGASGASGSGLQFRDLCVTFGITMTIEDSWGGEIATAALAHLAPWSRLRRPGWV